MKNAKACFQKSNQSERGLRTPKKDTKHVKNLLTMHQFLQQIQNDPFHSNRRAGCTKRRQGDTLAEDTAFLSVVKKYLDGLGIAQKTTRTHANIVERLIRTIKNGLVDRIRFTKGNWTDLYKPTLKKYNNTIHSSTGAKPVEAHKDENRVNVKVNLTLKRKHFRKYPQLSVGDKVKIYTKGAGNYISRKETNSR